MKTQLRPFAIMFPISALAIALLSGCGSSDDSHVHYIEVNEAAAPKHEPHQSGDVEVKEKTIRISLPVPTPAWSISITEVWVVGYQVWAICELKEADGMVAQVLTQATDSVTVRVPDLPVTYYILGRSFDWQPTDGNIVFIGDRSEINAGLSQGERVYPAGS